jgi:Putative DNA-binding domain
MTLDAAQRFVRDAVRGGEPVAATHAREVVADGRRLAPEEQLEVYREQFFLRHIHSLEDDFGCVVHLVGKVDFWDLARAYLLVHPPVHYDLHRLGEAFPAFVAARPGVDELVVDAARFDWAFMDAWGTLDAPPLRPESFAHAPESAWPGARLVFQPSLRLLRLAYPLDAFRRSIKRGEAPASPAAGGEHVAVYRGADARLCSGGACDKLAATLEAGEAALADRVGGWFQSWTASGWLSEVRF